MGCNFAPARRDLAGSGRKIEVCKGVSRCKLDLLRNRDPTVRASSRGWSVALLSFPADPSSDRVLRSPAFDDASYGYLCTRFTRGRSSLLSIIPCRLGHFLGHHPVGIPPAAHPDSPGLGNDHSFHPDNGLALFRRCAWWNSSRHYFCPVSESPHATNVHHPPPRENLRMLRIPPLENPNEVPHLFRGSYSARKFEAYQNSRRPERAVPDSHCPIIGALEPSAYRPEPSSTMMISFSMQTSCTRRTTSAIVPTSL